MDVAITGMGVVSPVGLSIEGFDSALMAGALGIRPAPWSTADAPALFGRVHDDFDAAEWMDERVVRGTDGFARFALAACAQALDDAGLAGSLDPFRTAVVHGTSMGGLFSLGKAQWAMDRAGPEAVDPKTQIKIWCNMAAAQLCMRYGLHGPSLTVTTACASSLDALGTAAMYLEAGLADVVLCGATEGGYTCDEPGDEEFVLATSAAEVSYGMSSAPTDPARAMLPFAADRAGIVSGEGSAFFVLETAEHAAARHAGVHARLVGYASLADAHHPSSPEPDGVWEERVVRLAQESAGIGPGDVDAVVAHATGTPKGDQAEIRALNRVFADGGNDRVVVTGLKGHTGHTGAASGGMNVIAGVHAMTGGRLANIAGTTSPDPEIRFDVALHEPRSVAVDVLQVTSYGFGGAVRGSVAVARASAMRFTVADCVAANAAAFPDRVALEELDPRGTGTEVATSWTYRDVWARAAALAGALGRVEPGPHGPMVAVLLPNCADHAIAYLAAQVAGAASVPVNSRLAAPEVEYVLTDSGASVLLTGHEHLAGARAVAERVGVRVVDVEEVTGDPSMPWSGPAGDGTGGQVTLVAYTSGTTGFPKGATVTHDALLTRFAQWGWTFGLSPDQVLSVPGPLFHMSYGGLTLAHLAAGGRTRIMAAFDPAVALDEYARHSTWVFLVPSMLAMIAEEWERAGRPPLEAVEWMLSSGAPGPMALLDRAFDVFPLARITEAYGWTEGGWVTYEVKDRAALVPHSVGWPMVGSEVAVIDADTLEPVGPGVAGEVVARTIVPFLGYLGKDDATAAAHTGDGFVRSGDMGIVLPDGRLTIVDRVKDMVISGGENIYGAEVERILLEHPGVLEAAIVGVPDETWGERVVAVVVRRDGAAGFAEGDLIGFSRDRLAHYKCPKQVVFVDALPRNPMGKVQKFRIVEELTALGEPAGQGVAT